MSKRIKVESVRAYRTDDGHVTEDKADAKRRQAWIGLSSWIAETLPGRADSPSDLAQAMINDSDELIALLRAASKPAKQPEAA